MDRMIMLARAFHAHRITAAEFRQSITEAVATMAADDLLSLAYLFCDLEIDNEMFDECELTNTNPGGT